MKVCVSGEIRIKFKQRGTIQDVKEVLTDAEIEENAVEFIKDDLKDTFDEIEVELINCDIEKKI